LSNSATVRATDTAKEVTATFLGGAALLVIGSATMAYSQRAKPAGVDVDATPFGVVAQAAAE
jgi:hypothetical protein